MTKKAITFIIAVAIGYAIVAFLSAPRLKAYDQARCLGYGLTEDCK